MREVFLFGEEPHELPALLRAVVAQRLVRVLCDRCKVPHRLTAADIDKDPRFAVIGFKAIGRDFMVRNA